MQNQTTVPILSPKQRKALVFSLVLAAALYLLVVFLAGYKDISSAFQRFGLTNWLIVLLCSGINYSLRFLRWQHYIKQARHSIPLGRHFLYYLAGFALTTTPGKAGETLRSMLLRPHGVDYPFSLACFFTERFLDVIVVALLASLTVFAFNEYSGFVIITSLSILSLLPYIRSALFINQLIKIDHWLKKPKLKKLLHHFTHLIRSMHILLSWKLIGFGLTVGMMAWLIQGFAFYLIITELGFSVTLLAALGIYAISLLAGAVSFIPGGVGSTEIVMALLLAALGADTSIVVSAPIISRLSTLWFAVLLGLLSTTGLTLKPTTKDGVIS